MPESTTHHDHEANERIPKKGGKLDKYKWWLIGGLAVIAILVFYFVRKSNSNAASQGSGASTQPGIDPATGVPYSQEYAGYGMGGFGGFGPGQTGATGPRGPRGGRGPRGPRGPKGPHDKDRIPHKPRVPRHRGGRQNATMAGAMLNGHNSRILPAVNRRPIPRVG